MTEKRFSVSFENNGCSKCLFLNSSDTGEDCKILKSEICEDEWSNIDFQFEKNWRYDGCPLIHHENLNEHKGIIAIKGDMSIEDSLNLLEENEQLKQQIGNLEHTRDFCADVCADCERLEKENEQLKKALLELKEIGDYQEGRIKELDKENEQLKQDINQSKILILSLKKENQKLKGRLNDLGVEYYD